MGNTCISSGEKTASGVVLAGKTLLAGVEIITNGANDATIILHDNASAASGTKLFEGGCVAADLSKFVSFDHKVQCSDGIYITVTGTGASAIVYYG